MSRPADEPYEQAQLETTRWLIAHDAELRARINAMRAREGRPPIDVNDPRDIERAARRLDERERKRERSAGIPRPPRGRVEADDDHDDHDDHNDHNEYNEYARRRGGPGNIDDLAGPGADPLQMLLALDVLREHVVLRIEIAASPRGGRPQGDVGPAQLLAMLRVLDSGKAAKGGAA